MIKTLKHNLLNPVYLILKLLLSIGVVGTLITVRPESKDLYLRKHVVYQPLEILLLCLSSASGRKIHFLTCAYCYQIPTKINL